MGVIRIYQILFFLQSAFIVFIMNYSRQSNIICTPHNVPCVCKFGEYDIRKIQSDAATIRPVILTPGQLSNCTLADIKKRPGVMMLTTTNLGFLDITLNMLESVKRTGVCVNTTIIAEDQKVYKYLRKRAEGDPGVHVMKTNSGETDSEVIQTKKAKTYFELLKKRQGYVLNLLEQGFEVFFIDADTFWFRDPFPYFQGSFDISMVDIKSPFPLRTSQAHFCSGLAYFKPTNVTLQFVKAWIQFLKGKIMMDQKAMNHLLQRDEPVHVNIKPLEPNKFPWGPKYYDLLKRKENYSTVIMHAASIHGHANKVDKFKSSNMWLVNATSLLHYWDSPNKTTH